VKDRIDHWLKRLYRRLGLSRCYWVLRNPTSRANWVFQHVVGVNRGCPWLMHYTSFVTHPERVHIHPSVGQTLASVLNLYIDGLNGVVMGEMTLIAPGVRIISSSHDVENLQRNVPCGPVRIGRHCWLGANVVILPGVELGDHVIVGAGSVVTRSFPANCVIAGVPARMLRSLAPAGSTKDRSPSESDHESRG
jgi:serine acetyltransferase